jgi:hypothetical protein
MQTQNAMVVDPSAITKNVSSVKEARALPAGTVIGDLHGGLTFTDAVAAALESRSMSGWQETHGPSGEIWTVIVLHH